MPPGTMRPRSRARAAALLALVTLLLLCGCFHKKKAAAPPLPVTPARLVLLPPNVPHDNQDLRWVSLAATVLMAKELENAQDVEVIPLWESLPIALETLGASRSISGETPAYVASRLNARWATQGELSPSKHGVSLLIDFIPTKSTMFSYRYQNESPVESLHSALREALEQFLRYLQVRPLSQKTKGGAALEIKQLRQLAEAMDREYGWFEPAEPGKAQQTFASLARTDTRLARLLFKPSAYSDTGTRPASNSPAEGRVPTAVVAEVPPETVAQPETRTQAPRSPDPAAKSEHPGAQIPRTPGAAPPAPASETNASSQTPRRPEIPPPSVAPAADPPRSDPSPSSGSEKSTAIPPAKTREETGSTPPAPRKKTFWLQVRATQDKAEAEADVAKFTVAGFQPEVVQVDLKKKGLWYRIQLQGFETRKAAEGAAKKLKAQGLISEYWIVP